MKLSRKTGIRLAVGAAVCLLCVCAFRATWVGHMFWPPRPVKTVSDVPVFTVPTGLWSNGMDVELWVRTIDEDPHSILITRDGYSMEGPDVPDQWPVFLYEGERRQLSSVDRTQWASAGGEITPYGGVGGGGASCGRKLTASCSTTSDQRNIVLSRRSASSRRR